MSEIYDGNPPHEARGCISQSTSVAALLYMKYVINWLKYIPEEEMKRFDVDNSSISNSNNKN